MLRGYVEHERSERLSAENDTLRTVAQRSVNKYKVLKKEYARVVAGAQWYARGLLSETKRPKEMAHVAFVVRNRVEADRFPDNVRDVLTEKRGGAWQFSAFDTTRSPFPRRWGPEQFPDRWGSAFAIGLSMYAFPSSIDPTNGADHFFSPVAMQPKYRAPHWYPEQDGVRVDAVEDHRFLFSRSRG